MRGAVGAVAVVAAVAAGGGWLYVLFQAGVLGAGPRVAGALPLQQLAGSDSQPLLRVAVAWLPAGLVAGAALAALTPLGRTGRAVAIAASGWVLLVATGAVSDAIALNERVGQHLAGEFGRAGTWAAVGLMVAGSLPAGRARVARRRVTAASGR